MKYLLLAAALLCAVSLQAQDLINWVPANADVVVSINGGNIQESVSLQELDNSSLGKQLLKKISTKTKRSITSFNDLGIETKANSYFYYTGNDSLNYTVLLLPLKTTSFFDDFAALDSTGMQQKEGYKMLPMGNSNYLAWNNKMLAYVAGNYTKEYFMDFGRPDHPEYAEEVEEVEIEMEEAAGEMVVEEEIMMDEEEEVEAVEIEVVEIEEEEDVEVIVDFSEVTETKNVAGPAGLDREMAEAPVEMDYESMPGFSSNQLQDYAFNYYSFSDAFKKAAQANNVAALDSLEDEANSLLELAANIECMVASDAQKLDLFLENKVYFLEQATLKFKDPKAQEKARNLITIATFYSTDLMSEGVASNCYEASANNYYSNIKEIEARWTERVLDEIMRPAQSSLVQNKAYRKQLDSKAAVNIWNRSYSGLMSKMYKGILGSSMPNTSSLDKMFSGYESVSSNLYLGKKEARLAFDMQVSRELAGTYGRMLDARINPKFFRYMNEENCLGYLAYNFNTKNLLEEYPKMMAEVYGGILPNQQQEMDLGLSLFSLLLDEKAASELIKGDALFLVSDFNEREVTYTAYEFDEEFKYKSVEKVKTEMMPDFLLMMSSEEQDFTKKLVAYMQNKRLITFQNGYYEIANMPSSYPIKLYFTFKNGIFFLGTSNKDMLAIANDSYKANVSRKHKRNIKQGNVAAYFNGHKFGQKFPIGEDLAGSNLQKIKYARDHAANFYITSSKLRKKNMKTEFVMEAPDNQKNALSYMLAFIDEMIKE